MPVLLAPALAAAGLTGGITLFGGATIGAFTIATADIAAYGITAAALVGVDLLANALSGGQKVDPKLSVKQAVPARVRAYGYCKLGGAFFVLEASGTLIEGFIHCQGPVYQIREWWLNDVQATGIAPGTLSGTSGLVPGKDKLLFDSQLGTANQTTNPGITAIIPDWGPSRRLRGLCNTVMRLELPSNPGKNFQTYYPGGVPVLRVVLQGALVYDFRVAGQNPDDDPRAPATWTWSQNAGLIIRDYLVHPDGMALSRQLINEASFAAFANLCDQLVNLADGTNEIRYVVLQGTYDLTEKRADVLKRLLATCDGELYTMADGTIGIRGGQWVAPTVTIDGSMIRNYTVVQGNGKLAAFNQYRIRYIDGNLDYQQVEGDPWDDVAAQAASGEVVAQDFDARMCGYNQARRLAKIAMHKANPQWTVELDCTMAAIDAFGEAVVTLNLDELGIAGTFAVSKFVLAGDLSGCTMTLSSLSSDAYQWDASQQGNPAPNPNVTVPVATIPAVTGLALSLVRTNVTGGINAAQIQATVATPLDTSVTVHGRYRVQGTTDWTDMTSNGDWSAISGIVNDGTVYEVEAAFQAFGGTDGVFVSDTIDVEADATAPDAPTDLDASLTGSVVDVGCTAPTSSNVYGVRFYRGATTVFTDASLIGSASAIPSGSCGYVDTPAPSGTNSYWATAINHSGVASDPVGPKTITV